MSPLSPLITVTTVNHWSPLSSVAGALPISPLSPCHHGHTVVSVVTNVVTTVDTTVDTMSSPPSEFLSGLEVADLDRKNISEKERLKKEMLRKIKETKLSLLAMTEVSKNTKLLYHFPFQCA
jgi:hypothetical protein